MWLSGPTNVGGTTIVVGVNAGPVGDTAAPPKISAILQSTSVNVQEMAQAANTAGTSWTNQILAVGNGDSRYNWFDGPNNRVIMALVDLVTEIASLGVVNLDSGALTTIAGPDSQTYNAAVVAVLPNGNIALALNRFAPLSGISFWTWNGSSWSGPVLLTDTGSGTFIPFPLDIAVDSNNVTYIAYQKLSLTNESIRVQSIDASGHLGPVCIVANGGTADSQPVGGRRMMLFNGQLWMAVMFASTQTAAVYRSGPTSALVFPNNTPVNFVQSTTAVAVAGDTYAGVGLMGSSTLYFIFNAQTGVIGSSLTSDRMVVNTYSGSGDTWNGLVTALDWVQHPPTGTGVLTYPTQHSHLWSSIQLPDSTFSTFVDFFDNVGNCFAFYTQFNLLASPLTASCAGLGSGTIGTPYSAFITAGGGTPPYTFAISSGSLPPGLSLNILTGLVSGTPTTAGTFPFTVQVTDSATPTPNVVTLSCSIAISSNAPTVTCGSPGPPNGTVGVPYSFTFPATGGIPPLVWGIVGGSFPPGLVLNAQTGVISGTPNTPGTFNFTVGATSTATGCGTGIAACIIVIAHS